MNVTNQEIFTKNWIFCSGNIYLVKTVNLTTINILKLLNKNCFDFWTKYILSEFYCEITKGRYILKYDLY